MTGTRAKIGFGDALGDLGNFMPSSPAKPVPAPEAAAQAGFMRREPVPIPAPQKQQRRRRTGRNAQINIKATPETLEAFYTAVDAMGCGVGEAFEMAVELLQKKLSDT